MDIVGVEDKIPDKSQTSVLRRRNVWSCIESHVSEYAQTSFT